MKKYFAKVIVTLKDEVKDTRALAVEKTLKRLEVAENSNFRTGKFYAFDFSAQYEQTALEKLGFICADVLSNPVVEKYERLEFKELK